MVGVFSQIPNIFEYFLPSCWLISWAVCLTWICGEFVAENQDSCSLLCTHPLQVLRVQHGALQTHTLVHIIWCPADTHISSYSQQIIYLHSFKIFFSIQTQLKLKIFIHGTGKCFYRRKLLPFHILAIREGFLILMITLPGNMSLVFFLSSATPRTSGQARTCSETPPRSWCRRGQGGKNPSEIHGRCQS